MGDIYISLPNKYRPRILDEIVGQAVLVKTLKAAIESDSVANVFLFSGSYGTGKTTTARVLSMAINCSNRENHNSCLKCKSCVAMQRSSHPDIYEIDAASNTGVDDVRIIIENSVYAPVLSRFKVYIIDEVHMLSQSAFNALLKTLEEPKQHVKFFLATTELHKIPMTIKSRCQHFQLMRPNNHIISAQLKKVSELEKIEITQDAIDFIAENSHGSLRDAISMLERSASYDTKITGNLIKEILGVISDSDSQYIANQIIQGNYSECLSAFNKVYEMGYDPIIIFEEITKRIHHLIKRALELNDYSVEFLSRILKCLISGIQDVKNSPNHFITGEILLIRLCLLKNLPSPAELVQNDFIEPFQNRKTDDNIKQDDLTKRILGEFKGSEIID